MTVRKLGTRNRLFLGREYLAHMGVPLGGRLELLKQADGSIILRGARSEQPVDEAVDDGSR